MPLDRRDRQVSRKGIPVPKRAVRFGKLHLYPKEVERNFDRRADFVNLSVAWCVPERITLTWLAEQERRNYCEIQILVLESVEAQRRHASHFTLMLKQKAFRVQNVTAPQEKRKELGKTSFFR